MKKSKVYTEEYFKEMGRKGAMKVYKKYGKKHMSKMGKISQKQQKKHK